MSQDFLEVSDDVVINAADVVQLLHCFVSRGLLSW